MADNKDPKLNPTQSQIKGTAGKKVIVIKKVVKKSPVVKLKEKGPVEENVESSIPTFKKIPTPANLPPIEPIVRDKGKKEAEKSEEPQKKPIDKSQVITGQSYLNRAQKEIESNRLKSSFTTGPVIIKNVDLPPLYSPAPSKSENGKSRVVGIVGGTGQRNQRESGNFQRGQRDRNSDFAPRSKDRTPRAGESYTPSSKGGQNGFGGNRFMNQRPGFTPRSPLGAKQGTTQSLDLNQKGKGRSLSQNSKKKDYDRYTKDQETDFVYRKKKEDQRLQAVPKSIDIMESITVGELAKKMNLKANDIISKLFSMGMMVNINQQIDHETVEIIASEYNCSVHLVSLYDETIIETEEDRVEDQVPRAPIVTVMGHVDHGKTKLLDAIRNTNVVSGEFGGITQHIGAYKVSTEKGDIVFLDTPGHAAFSMMRARGAQVTDIVVLVVAANDGVMPQTKEAIDHAKAAKVPIIVAINKMDLYDANPDRVMQQLSELGLMPEEWGGQTLYCKISALKKEGIDELLDTILLQAEMLELKANPTVRAEGKVLESRIDQGRGTVASIIIQKGTLRQGDYYVAGIYSGRVRAMFDDKGKKILEAGPSDPVEIIGLSNIPSAGDPFQVTEDEKTARSIAAKRQELERLGEGSSKNKITLENLSDKILEGQIIDFNVIIKGDVQGSVEALEGVLEKLSNSEIKLNVLRASAGAIIESDISLAAASDAVVIGFNVRPTPRAQALAEQEKVEIKKYNIIYDVVDDIKAAMEGKLSPDIKEVDIGKAEVRQLFKVPKIGIIAGSYVIEGKVKRNAFARIIRDSIQLNKGLVKISSLRRIKDDVKEVNEGYECGIGLENWQDLEVGDILEIVETQEVKRKLEEA